MSASLSMLDLQRIHVEWAKHWGNKSAAERNKQLASRMKLATLGDAYGMDMAKQGAKEFLSGAISAREYKDLFVGVILMGEELHPGLGEELFKEMAMLVPVPDKRAQLLSLCEDPFVLPTDRTTKFPTADIENPKAPVVREEEDEAEDEGETYEEGQDEEYEDEEEDEEGSSYADEQEEDYEGEEDLKEFKGWQVLDRSRIQALVAERLANESQSSDKGEAESQEDKSGAKDRPLMPVIGDEDGSTHVNSSGNRPARKLSKYDKKKRKRASGSQ
jgi:hypothetical protein